MKAQPMITVQDVRRSADWYERVLGFQSAHGGTEYEQLLSDGELVLQLHDPEGDMNHPPLLGEGEPAGLGVLLWFAVWDFEQAMARVHAAGITPEVAPYLNRYAMHMEVWLHDPDGYRVVLAGPSAYDKQHEGASSP